LTVDGNITVGSDCVGHVANEVETEQIFIRTTSSPGDCPRVSSVVQCRGSIPLYWSHTNLYNPKPDVQLEDSGLGSEQSAKIHFQKLFNRYGTVSLKNVISSYTFYSHNYSFALIDY
jgi:hypothetical protein